MIIVTAVENTDAYLFTATDGTEENTFVYEWAKILPNGQTKTQYLQNCKREAQLLAENEISRKQPPVELVI